MEIRLDKQIEFLINGRCKNYGQTKGPMLKMMILVPVANWLSPCDTEVLADQRDLILLKTKLGHVPEFRWFSPCWDVCCCPMMVLQKNLYIKMGSKNCKNATFQ